MYPAAALRALAVAAAATLAMLPMTWAAGLPEWAALLVGVAVSIVYVRKANT